MSDDLNDSNDKIVGLLRGAPAIAAFLQTLPGFRECTKEDVYYFHRSKKFSFGKFGNELITTESKILRQVRKLVA